jgi:hypothetical protein
LLIGALAPIAKLPDGVSDVQQAYKQAMQMGVATNGETFTPKNLMIVWSGLVSYFMLSY